MQKGTKHRENYLPLTLIVTVAEPNSLVVAPVKQTGQPEQSEEQPEQAEKRTPVRQGPLLPDTVTGKSVG